MPTGSSPRSTGASTGDAVRHFVLPDLGEGLTAAEIVAWHVAVGDEVSLNQVLVEVETEKAVVELPSPYAGTVLALLAEAGESVVVGAPIVAVGTTTEQGEAPGRAGGEGADAGRLRPVGRTAQQAPEGTAPPRRPPGTPLPAAGRPLAAPPVRFMARQRGVDLARVAGHGPGGVITREDLAAHLAGAPTVRSRRGAAARRGRPSVGSRSTWRRRWCAAWRARRRPACSSRSTSPRRCTSSGGCGENRRFEGLRVTPLAVVARAVLLALRDHAALNSSWDDATAEVVTKHYVNLGIAVAGPSGLVVPNIKDAQDLTLRDLVGALADLADRARPPRCTPADLRGGTITVTNVGVFGVDAGVPILNPGEAAILAVGAIARRPWVFADEVAPRDVMTLSLSFDHRLVDGQAASRFLAAVGEILSDPTNLIAFG